MQVVEKSQSFLNLINIRTIGIYLGSFSIVAIIWEHIAKKYVSNIKPSVALEKTANFCQWVFEYCGRKIAWFSSYLTMIDLKEIGQTIFDIAKPTFNLLSSPYYFIKGYAIEASSYLNKEWLIYVGSALMIAGFAFGSYKLADHYPKLNILSPLFKLFRNTGLLARQ